MIRRILPSYKHVIVRGKQTAVQELSNFQDYEEDDEIDRERIIEEKRNKSRLLPQHRNMVLGKVPYQEPQSWIHETVKYKRMMYGRYGSSSNVNPALCWPDKVDLEDTLEYERVKYPETIPEMMKKVAEEKKQKAEAMRARDEEIAKKLLKLQDWKHQLKQKMAKAEAEAREAKERKDRLVEEVRRHFGFKLDPRDEKFQEMLAQKEKADRKQQKELRRQAREAKIAANLINQQNAFKENEEEEK
ncbi:growth arrest and DNA damage-inducible proteins-interacting protein 1-like [Ctenocephalides felis]|uniref:growth arrest and DNA damage-inducible proteins-interacting protein 1-like n=1 Tax=Ctenocephalides felis TaxID=7515 RepID=UPI000E6E52A2|nr:growth arrest and DNA damage-inducible proteins-interacting protein 1-like [Ctenocephalides felis]